MHNLLYFYNISIVESFPSVFICWKELKNFLKSGILIIKMKILPSGYV